MTTTQLSPETRRRICRELAERMGYKETSSLEIRPLACANIKLWIHPQTGQELFAVPDYFTDHEANAKLMEWLVSESCPDSFNEEVFLTSLYPSYGLNAPFTRGQIACATWAALTSPLPVRVMAACAALGIETGDES